MTDLLCNEPIGRRIICDGEYGTVRYAGTVPPTSGSWLGVEWDNPFRGKHDGSHEGTRYFACRHPTGSSFIRPKKANFGVSFTTAVYKRYSTNDEWKEKLVVGKKTVELVGFESIQEEQSHLNTLSDISLRESEISHSGEKEEIRQSCPNISVLNLSKNLLPSWKSVADITCQLEKLKNLDLSENRLSLPSDPPALASAFSSLTLLSLSRTGITWKEVLQCAVMWPALEELHLASNEIDMLERPVNCFQTLRLLNISNNKLTDGNQLHAISALPRLTQLIISNNNVSSIEFPVAQLIGCNTEMFSSLNSLLVDGNNISKWSFFNELNKLKSLQSLKCQNNPLMDSEKNPETVRQIIIAKIEKLKYLNKTEILPNERRGAELDYRKMFGIDWLKAGGNPNNDISNPSMEFIIEHPRYNSLVEKYGTLEEGELKPVEPVTLKNQLISLTIKCPNNPDKKPIKKKLPDSMTVQKVKGLLYRLLKVPGSELKLSYESTKMEGTEIELENDLKSLQFYSIENGDCVLVRW